MQVYLLSIKELLYHPDEDAMNAVRAVQLRQRALQMLDEHRREKSYNIKAETAQSQSIGAGLLLQYAVQAKDRREAVAVLSVSEILDKIKAPVSIGYAYDMHGKPDFAEGDWHFNLSHSGEYVCLVIDKQPVGVDIQHMRPLKNYHLAERYFSEKELSKLEKCRGEAEKAECFYDIWVKKEAYAKLTGEGIGRTVKLDTEDTDNTVCWHAFEAPAGYRLTVCTRFVNRDKSEE